MLVRMKRSRIANPRADTASFRSGAFLEGASGICAAIIICLRLENPHVTVKYFPLLWGLRSSRARGQPDWSAEGCTLQLSPPGGRARSSWWKKTKLQRALSPSGFLWKCWSQSWGWNPCDLISSWSSYLLAVLFRELDLKEFGEWYHHSTMAVFPLLFKIVWILSSDLKKNSEEKQ